MQQKISAIITGATGMVGEGVLQECLQSEQVERVLVIGRKPCGCTHPKLTELIHADFFDMSSIEPMLAGYNACYFCLGISSVGVDKPTYFSMTHTLALHFAETVLRQSPELTFCYVSGEGTDTKERGTGWTAVKGKTENDLAKLPFRAVYNFRPGFMHPTEGLQNTLPYYKYIGWAYPLARATGYATLLSELGQAMIKVSTNGYKQSVLKVRDIIAAAK